MMGATGYCGLFFFQAEDGIRDVAVTGVQTCALPISATVAGSAGALPGTGAASVKVTPLHEYPGKGRATGGVRCHRFLKGEDMLVMAWAGPAPAGGATETGTPGPLPGPVGERGGSGTALRPQIALLGGSGRGGCRVCARRP